MLEGSLQHHKRADVAGHETDDRGRQVQRRVWVWSNRLKIAGIADFVEADPQTDQIIPVEYKHGRQGTWDNDQVQLCAQALCLEEMLGINIEQGEIFYRGSRKRIIIALDNDIRKKTELAIQKAYTLMGKGIMPNPVTPDEQFKCQHCSIEPICLPAETRQLVKIEDRG